MSIFIVRGLLEPESFAHEWANEVTVVAFADVEFEGGGVGLDVEGSVESIRVVQDE